MARVRSGARVVARSAGSHPKPLHANAVRVMGDEYGIDLAGWRLTHLDELARQRFDQVITLCDRVREICPEFAGQPETVHWSLPDPSAGFPSGDHEASYPTFRLVAADLDTRIGFLLAALRHRADPSTPTRQEDQ